MPSEPSSADRRHYAPSVIDLLNNEFDPDGKQLVTAFEPENLQIFIDEERLSKLGLTLPDLARFLRSQPFLFWVFTSDEVRQAAAGLQFSVGRIDLLLTDYRGLRSRVRACPFVPRGAPPSEWKVERIMRDHNLHFLLTIALRRSPPQLYCTPNHRQTAYMRKYRREQGVG